MLTSKVHSLSRSSRTSGLEAAGTDEGYGFSVGGVFASLLLLWRLFTLASLP